jgi:uncharacterized protein YdaT
MPYGYPDNVPSVAKNWTADEQKACIEAANAVLAEGDDDSETNAIYACIAAAGKSKRGRAADEKLLTKAELAELTEKRRKKLLRQSIEEGNALDDARFAAAEKRLADVPDSVWDTAMEDSVE